jgi:hypothetical protein
VLPRILPENGSRGKIQAQRISVNKGGL